MAANHLLVIKRGDTAIWRRIKLIPFDLSIPLKDQDPNLAKKLEAEPPGILNWAVQGYLQWQEEGLNPLEEVSVARAVNYCGAYRIAGRIRTGDPLNPIQVQVDANHGKESSKPLLGCTICRPCHERMPEPAGLQQRE